jgi:hypothetical protein
MSAEAWGHLTLILLILVAFVATDLFLIGAAILMWFEVLL